ncbi:MAG: glycosyltransferase [Pseudomonadales bacterium]|nr:glycosyltransferase [Pseudomonadales bacterium]
MSHTLYIVSGMHRSGTSAVARMLEVYGVSLPGDLVAPAADNQKGFFEDRSIVELNTEILEKLGLRWDSLDGFFLRRPDFSSPKFNQLKHRARRLLEIRVAEEKEWAFKDPRICRLLCFWMPIIEDLNIPYRFVIAVRNPAEVAGSLSGRNSFSHLKSLYLWLFYNLDLLDSTTDYPRAIVHYEKLVSSPEETMSSLDGFFPAVLESKKADFLSSFLSEDLHHNRGTKLDADLAITDELFDLLQYRQLSSDRVAALKKRVVDQHDLQAVLQLVSIRESQSEVELRQQQAELSAVIERKEKEVAEYRDYTERKEKEVAEYRDYQKKLESRIHNQKDWVAKLTGDIDELQADLKRTESEVSEKLDVIQKIENELDLQKVAAEKESMRLWAIVEKYRLEVEQMLESYSWRVTAPVRWLRRVIQQAPGKALNTVRQMIRKTVFSLPPNSMLRQLLLRSYERGQILLHGGVDNNSIRNSHQSIIAARDQLLGEKPLLSYEDLPELDISIVVYNSERWIESFVSSLEAQDYPLDKLHLVFVDNGSTDNTADCLEQIDWSAFGSFRCLKNTNVGYGEGHNRGIAEGVQPFFLVTNIDLQFLQDSLRQAVSFASQDEADVASWELRQAPFEHPKFYDPVTLQTAWSSHACILMRRKVFEAAGGYERRIFMYGEDVELSYRFRSLGYKLRYLPAASVDHFTYEEAGEVKPLQYSGSTLANAYLRLRYGSLVDAMAIVPMYSHLLVGSGGVAEHRKLIWINLLKIFQNGAYFLGRRKESGAFSFRGWDYEIVRDGAFYENHRLKDGCPLVSVVTRTYRGREKLLAQCLQSVAHQTYPNVEHIIVEDGGATMRPLIECFKTSYPGAEIKHVSLEKVGRCRAGNTGLEASQGKYIAFLDDDDLFFLDHLEVCVSELESDESVSAAYALAWEVETEFDGPSYKERSHATPAVLHQCFDRNVLHDHNYIPIQAIVFERTLFEEHGGFDPDLENLEDWNLWIKFASNASFKMIEKTTSMYRTPWNLSEKSRRQATLDNYLEAARIKNESYKT